MMRGWAGRLLACLLALALVSGGALRAAEAEEFPELEERYSGVIEVPGMGPMLYYAQNDPLWADAVYEAYNSIQRRGMAQSGCGPTVAAMAMANLLTPEELTRLLGYTRETGMGFPMCPYSVNGRFHDASDHQLFYPTTPEDFVTYLPMILATYAAGNNSRKHYYRRGDGGGTALDFFRAVASDYGVEYTQVKSRDKANEYLQNGSVVITTASKGAITAQSHYLLFVGLQDGWVYLLDPYWRDTYDNDTRGLIEVLQPGLIRYPAAENDRVNVYCYYVFSRKSEE